LKTRIGVLCGCAVLLLIAALLHAKPGIVKTNDGHTYEGDVTETGTAVTVKTRNVPITIQRADIESIEYLGTLDEQYAQRMARLDAKDVNGRVTVARWAFDQGRYDLARNALESALTLEPNNREANQMLDSVRVQIRLERAKRDAATTAETRRAATSGPATAPATVASSAPQPVDPRNLLTADDINAIRQFELKPSDTHVRINFSRDVKKRFATANNIRIQDFNALPQFEQLRRILEEGAPDMKRDVRIVSDPSSILEYRRNIQPVLLGSCATSGCHGPQTGAGGLLLYSPPESEAITYTNFFIIQTYARQPEQRQGPFGAAERRLIDRIEPSNSLLLNYGLPPNIAEYDHPQVSGYRPIFRNRDDNGYRRLEGWIRDSLRATKPEYDVNFTPPTRSAGGGGGDGGGAGAPTTAEGATTQPASPPATQPAR
jgi:hypothetical protein